MKSIECQQCGGKEFFIRDGYRVCKYCNAVFVFSKEELPHKNVTIDLNQDVQRLLDKCKREPYRAKKYARLILEIDPNNEEAKSILNLS